MNQEAGKVWLVGAGPGDIGLFTLKGKEVLKQAEVVVYDSLIGDAILCLIPDEAEKIDVGKRAGNHPVPQQEINRILLEKAKEGKRVVRLKGGDPFLFGRGGEELILLAEQGVPFEIVPGISSAFAVPAYAGIPVTHRDFASSVHVITGHRRADTEYTDGAAVLQDTKERRGEKVAERNVNSREIDYEALVRAGGTLLFLMGVSALSDICQNLIRAGMAADTPAAIVQEGATAGQRILLATVDTLPRRAAEEKIMAPAVIVVGGVCGLHDEFAWRDTLPLAGLRILLTRPRERMSSLAGKLREGGADVLEQPAIRIRPLNFNECAGQKREAGNPERRRTESAADALRHIAAYDWLVFTSPSGVNIFFGTLMREAKLDIRVLSSLKIAVLGPGTGREITARGMYPDLMPKTYDAASLGRCLAKNCERNAKILIPRAAAGTPALTEELKKRPDLTVTDLAIYETVPETGGILNMKKEFLESRVDCAVFTSASGVRGFAARLSLENAKTETNAPGGENTGSGAAGAFDFSAVTAVCIGAQTAAAAESLGMRVFIAREATEEAIAEKITEIFDNKR